MPWLKAATSNRGGRRGGSMARLKVRPPEVSIVSPFLGPPKASALHRLPARGTSQSKSRAQAPGAALTLSAYHTINEHRNSHVRNRRCTSDYENQARLSHNHLAPAGLNHHQHFLSVPSARSSVPNGQRVPCYCDGSAQCRMRPRCATSREGRWHSYAPTTSRCYDHLKITAHCSSNER